MIAYSSISETHFSNVVSSLLVAFSRSALITLACSYPWCVLYYSQTAKLLNVTLCEELTQDSSGVISDMIVEVCLRYQGKCRSL